MAKPLIFQLAERQFSCFPNKVSREKLYGRVEKTAIDQNERPLEKSYLDDTGSFLIDSFGMGYVTEEQEWAARSTLAAVNTAGEQLTQLPSSFDRPIPLERTVTLDEYCEHIITQVYRLENEQTAEITAELDKLENELYTFSFNYRSGYEAKPAFLIAGDNGLHLVVGRHTACEFIGPNTLSIIDEINEEDDDPDQEEELDFQMF